MNVAIERDRMLWRVKRFKTKGSDKVALACIYFSWPSFSAATRGNGLFTLRPEAGGLKTARQETPLLKCDPCEANQHLE
jgi:hypothetical protein